MAGMDSELAKIRAEEAASVYDGTEPPEREDINVTPEVQEKQEYREEQQPADDENLEDEAQAAPITIEELNKTISTLSSKLGAIDELSSRLKQVERRAGSIANKVFNSEQKQVTETIEKEKAALEDELATFKEEFPTLDNAITKRLELQRKSAKSSEELQNIQQTVNELKSSLGDKVVTKDQLEVTLLTTTYPDWRDIVTSNEYVTWLNEQDAATKDLAANGTTAADGIAVIKSFKAHQSGATKTKQTQTDRRTQRLKSAVASPGRSAPPSKSEQDMTDAEYRAYIKSAVYS